MNPEYTEWLLQLWNSPERNAIMAAGGWAAYYNSLAATTVPEFAGAAAIGTVALPVITMAGVFVALGSGYAAAREIARDENTQSGFSQGFVMGLLGWEWRHARDRFGRFGVLRVYQTDEALNVIRVNAYNGGLKAGYAAAAALDENGKRGYLSRLRKLAHGTHAGNWTRNHQISYVIELASAGLRYGVIGPQ